MGRILHIIQSNCTLRHFYSDIFACAAIHVICQLNGFFHRCRDVHSCICYIQSLIFAIYIFISQIRFLIGRNIFVINAFLGNHNKRNLFAFFCDFTNIPCYLIVFIIEYQIFYILIRFQSKFFRNGINQYSICTSRHCIDFFCPFFQKLFQFRCIISTGYILVVVITCQAFQIVICFIIQGNPNGIQAIACFFDCTCLFGAIPIGISNGTALLTRRTIRNEYNIAGAICFTSVIQHIISFLQCRSIVCPTISYHFIQCFFDICNIVCQIQLLTNGICRSKPVFFPVRKANHCHLVIIFARQNAVSKGLTHFFRCINSGFFSFFPGTKIRYKPTDILCSAFRAFYPALTCIFKFRTRGFTRFPNTRYHTAGVIHHQHHIRFGWCDLGCFFSLNGHRDRYFMIFCIIRCSLACGYFTWLQFLRHCRHWQQAAQHDECQQEAQRPLHFVSHSLTPPSFMVQH